MKRFEIIFILLSATLTLQSQLSPVDVDGWIATWPYATVENIDSLSIWAEKLRNAEISLSYPRAGIYATRLDAYY